MPRRAVPVDPSIGERIKARRQLRRWSIRHAASRAGIAHTTWSRIERGELRTDRYMIADLAAALECSVTDLTGQPYAPADRRLEAAHVHAERVWQALMAHPLSDPPDVAADPMAALEAEATLVRDLYGRTDYAGVLGRLVAFVPLLHAAAHGPDAATALRLMVPVYGVAMGSLLNVGYPAHAWLAAERSTEAAQYLDDPVALGVTAANRARVSAASGAYRPAYAMCERAADGLDRLTDPDALPVLGFLHLARAHQATGMREHGGADDHLTEAAQLAARTGAGDGWDLAWGPSNVALWTMAVRLDTGRPDDAVSAASDVDVAGLPHVRRVYLYLDLARALADLRRDGDAVRTLLVAERTGPQHTRSSTAARELARSLLGTAGGSELRALAERMGVAS